MTFRERFRERLERQGKKIEYRYRDRPISKERYEKRMMWIAGAVVLYLVLSLLCIIKVIGEWWT